MCTLNVALVGETLPLDIFDILAIASHEDYQRNSHGVGYYTGKGVKKSFDWFPMGLRKPDELGNCFMVHTRLATCAKDSKEALQPFEFDYGESMTIGKVYCMHNGIFRFNKNRDTTVFSDSYIYFDELFNKIADFETEIFDKPPVAGQEEAYDYAELVIKPAIEAMEEEHIASSSYYSCFMWSEELNEGFYWKRGANMFIYEGEDMVYLSTQDKSKLINSKMLPVRDKTLYRFYEEKGGNFTYEEYKLDMPEARYPLIGRNGKRRDYEFGDFFEGRLYQTVEDIEPEGSFSRKAY